jgi:hypothetical protein
MQQIIINIIILKPHLREPFSRSSATLGMTLLSGGLVLVSFKELFGMALRIAAELLPWWMDWEWSWLWRGFPDISNIEKYQPELYCLDISNIELYCLDIANIEKYQPELYCLDISNIELYCLDIYNIELYCLDISNIELYWSEYC